MVWEPILVRRPLPVPPPAPVPHRRRFNVCTLRVCSTGVMVRMRLLVAGWVVDLALVALRLARFGLVPVVVAEHAVALSRRSLESVGDVP